MWDGGRIHAWASMSGAYGGTELLGATGRRAGAGNSNRVNCADGRLAGNGGGDKAKVGGRGSLSMEEAARIATEGGLGIPVMTMLHAITVVEVAEWPLLSYQIFQNTDARIGA